MDSRQANDAVASNEAFSAKIMIITRQLLQHSLRMRAEVNNYIKIIIRQFAQQQHTRDPTRALVMY